MMFKRKQINRKIKKRPNMYRMKRSLMDWIKLYGTGFAVIVLVVVLYRFFAYSNFFKIERVMVNGHLTHTTPQEILALTGLSVDNSLFSVDLPQVIHNVKREPWINFVSVRRIFPDKIVLDVVEYVPSAILALKDGSGSRSYFLVNEDGKIFKSIKNVNEYKLPVVTGFEKEKLEKFPNFFASKLNSVFQFLKDFNMKEGLEDVKVSEINYNDTDGLTLVCNTSKNPQNKIQIYFGVGDYAPKFSSLELFLKQTEQEGVVYRRVDLHVDGKIFARL
ncbi:FtsQ-type POTRA domain-containing protein [bacterium]|nr:FtsQ-type POTRA domain-containing protein [bacterium]